MGNEASVSAGAGQAGKEEPAAPPDAAAPMTRPITTSPKPRHATAAVIKRPGGSGMAVSPQRRREHVPSQTIETSPTGARRPERHSPTSPLPSTGRHRANCSPRGKATTTSKPIPPPGPSDEEPSKGKEAKEKQDLVHKLQSFVRSSSIKQALESSPATPPVVPERHRPDATRRTSWLAKLGLHKEEILQSMRAQPQQHTAYSEPLTYEQVGQSVETTLGKDLPAFASLQGAIHTAMDEGLKPDMLDQFLFDEEGEQQLTTYEKWSVIRHAAEQMLQVYATRSNSSWIEAEQWQAPTVVEASVVAQSGYANAVDRALSRGEVALLFIDDGRQCRCSSQEGDIAPLIATDVWQAVKELAPHKVPSTHRLEHLTVLGRHLLNASVSVEAWYGAAAMRKTKAVVAVDSEQELMLVGELLKWDYFGFEPENLVVLPLPRFHGFTEDQRTGHLAHVKNSPKLMLGTGYALFLLNSPAEAYTLSRAGEPRCLSTSVLSWLDEQHAGWIYSGLFSDVQRLRPEAFLDVDFLAAALYCADSGGCNMAMEVVHGERERDVRHHDSIVLRRTTPASTSTTTATTGNCNLRASAMRSVRSYQIIQQHINAKAPDAAPSAPGTAASGGGGGGFYVSTQRYAFKVSALQQLLLDATQFRMDVALYGFYAYANLDLADITAASNASCACIVSSNLKGPPMVDVVMGKDWLAYTAAPVLEMQDKVPEFRRKAIELLKLELPGSVSKQLPGLHPFKERRPGSHVVLVMSLEHGRLAHAALRLARLFVRNIVDRLHLVVVLGPGESRHAARALLEELGDKELDFQQQLLREVLVRESDPLSSSRDRDVACVREYCSNVHASLVVVPSSTLASPGSSSDLGSVASSLSWQLLRFLTTFPILLVKANSIARLNPPRTSSSSGSPSQSPGGQSARPSLIVMCHLDTSQSSSMVEAITPFMVPNLDLLYLVRTQAFEKPGQLSMRSRRMFVQARMAVSGALKVEERAYALSASVELPKAIESESVDLVVMSAAGALAPNKEVEDILRTAKCCVFVHRSLEQAPGGVAMNNLMSSV